MGTMILKFAGRCDSCQEKIAKGEQAQYIPETKKVRHLHCGAPAQAAATQEQMAVVLERQQATDARNKAEAERSKIKTRVLLGGEHPSGLHTLDGETVATWRTPSGYEASWFVVTATHLWFLMWNGDAADDNRQNNVIIAGSARAKGWRLSLILPGVEAHAEALRAMTPVLEAWHAERHAAFEAAGGHEHWKARTPETAAAV
jgi:hypothetical protein